MFDFKLNKTLDTYVQPEHPTVSVDVVAGNYVLEPGYFEEFPHLRVDNSIETDLILGSVVLVRYAYYHAAELL